MNAKVLNALQELVDCPDYRGIDTLEMRRAREILNDPESTIAPPLVIMQGDNSGITVYTADGNEYPSSNITLIDFCLEDVCPVCREFPFRKDESCPECGYLESEENEIECAVRRMNPQSFGAVSVAEMLNAIKVFADLMDEALTAHIYNEDDGEFPEAGDPYVKAIKQGRDILNKIRGEK